MRSRSFCILNFIRELSFLDKKKKILIFVKISAAYDSFYFMIKQRERDNIMHLSAQALKFYKDFFLNKGAK